MASTESVEVDELEFCVWSSHVFKKSDWIFRGQFSKKSIKSSFLRSSQKPQASPCFPGNFFTNWCVCFDLDHKDVAMFSSRTLIWWISAIPHQVSLVCSLMCTITWSKLPQYEPSCVLAVQNEPGACSGSKTPRVYRALKRRRSAEVSPFPLLSISCREGPVLVWKRFYSNASKQKAVCSISISLENWKRKTFQSCN